MLIFVSACVIAVSMSVLYAWIEYTRRIAIEEAYRELLEKVYTSKNEQEE